MLHPPSPPTTPTIEVDVYAVAVVVAFSIVDVPLIVYVSTNVVLVDVVYRVQLVLVHVVVE